MLVKRFTLIELVAVISIMSILFAIGFKGMSTDSTTANAVILGNCLKYAQIYAMSKTSSLNNYSNANVMTPDGFADDCVVVTVSNNSIAKGTSITIVHTSQNGSIPAKLVQTEMFLVGTKITVAGVDQFSYGFRRDGSPIIFASPRLPVFGATGITINLNGPNTFNAITQTSLTSQVTFTVQDTKNASNSKVVKLKPFTGKVIFY